jgi:hypothetical protein
MMPKLNYVKKTGNCNVIRKISLQQQHRIVEETKTEPENI